MEGCGWQHFEAVSWNFVQILIQLWFFCQIVVLTIINGTDCPWRQFLIMLFWSMWKMVTLRIIKKWAKAKIVWVPSLTYLWSWELNECRIFPNWIGNQFLGKTRFSIICRKIYLNLNFLGNTNSLVILLCGKMLRNIQWI